jgi:medium-chain acyl-[acyl-carrier-protein] hydrolase
MAVGQWVYRFVPRPLSGLRLFCFHHAGGGAAAYRSWAQQSSEDIEVCAVQLPGRGDRLRESPLTTVPEIVARLLPALRGELDRPFAFFGHSMGAVVATEAARALVTQGAPAPRHLFVSGRRPPHVADPQPPLAGLDDAAFVAEINRRYGGIPAELLEHADVMALLLPGLRADILALETFNVRHGATLDCPISAYGGAADPLTPHEHLEAWRHVTRGPFRVRRFPGDHFYLEPQRSALLTDIVQSLRWALVPHDAAAEARAR